MSRIFSFFSSVLNGTKREFFIALMVVLVIMMLIIPMPAFLLDFFISLNLLLAVVVILNVIYIKSALEFSVFPSLLLMSTVFSLALNVSSTRLILSQGEEFNGQIVRAFGRFVVGTEGVIGVFIGVVIFSIVIAVQFIVITKGATRVSEVSARFTLDALPGKQMSIEAEFNSGAISEDELLQRRRMLQQEVDFYGSMDGASKFVSGNVKAGILITFINIIGGLAIGVLLRGEQIGSAAITYVQLTIGDGLVSQFPSLLVSTASGIIVTRTATAGSNLGDELSKEFSKYKRIYIIAGGLLVLLGFLPGFPWYLLVPMGGLLIFGSLYSIRNTEKKVVDEKAIASQAEKPHVEAEQLEPLDAISLEIGYDLVPLVQSSDDKTELLNRISSIRRELGVKLGLVIPLVRIQDNYLLKPAEYSIHIYGIEIGKGVLRPNSFLAIRSTAQEGVELEGEQTTDPVFGIPAIWIHKEMRGEAEKKGFTVADPASVVATHLSNAIEEHAARLLSRQDSSRLVETCKEKSPALIEDLKASQNFSIGIVQYVLRRLLEEKISIRNLEQIFETMGDYLRLTNDRELITEKVRQSLSRQICSTYADRDMSLQAFVLDPSLEDAFVRDAQGNGTFSQEQRSAVLQSLRENMQRFSKDGGTLPVLVVSERARPVLYTFLKRNINKRNYGLPLLSVLEIAEEYTLKIINSITIEKETINT